MSQSLALSTVIFAVNLVMLPSINLSGTPELSSILSPNTNLAVCVRFALGIDIVNPG